jgi:cobalt-zinc-cadmium efflux system outer membrane protein
MPFPLRSVAVAAAALALSGCASLPTERGYTETRALIDAQRPLPTEWSPLDHVEPAAIPATPIGVDDAVRLAFFRNPRIRETYARLGIGRAELEEARRLANPTFGFARLTAQSGDGSQITRSLSFGLTDLLLLPARKRLAEGELDHLQKAVAGEVLALATEVEVAWYEAVGAAQIAAMRDLVAQAAERSADLAQRFFDAGNINRLQLEQERAAATQARIEALAAGAEALRARSALGGLIGLPISADWRLQTQLPAPLAVAFSADTLIPLALEARLDLAAARQALALREDALGVTRRWRWFGTVEVGYEREREFDGGLTRGPSVALGLPLFNQGQGAVARAQAELLQAQAELDAKVFAVHDTARLGIERLTVAATIAERYRSELVPRREAIVARTQERVNFMLVGVFELLVAKQQEYDAYQAYLESVRDYWTARAELRGAVGGRLPDDDQPLPPTVGVEAILPAASAAPMDHSAHGGATPATEADPHAGHRMPEAPSARNADPHAGLAMPKPPSGSESEPPLHAGAHAQRLDAAAPHERWRQGVPSGRRGDRARVRARDAARSAGATTAARRGRPSRRSKATACASS